jgi:putative ABC transport system permease protein
MNLLEAMRIALASLWANKLRSILTLLGIVIGVAAVIAVVTFINGLNAYVAEKIATLGSDVVSISKSPNFIGDYDTWQKIQRRKDFKRDDYDYLKDTCQKCVNVAASRSSTSVVKAGTESSNNTVIRGWTPSMIEVADQEITSGRAITEVDDQTASKIAIVGTDIVENLLGDIDPVGH